MARRKGSVGAPPLDAGDDLRFMRRALALAERGWGQVSPNPLVGAVVVRDGTVVGEGYHAAFGREHAEGMALGRAGAQARGSTVYVTLEPCNHHGKTPPCTEALITAGVARVVIAVRDPHPVAAGGADRLRAAGIAVDVGLGERAARDLNAHFLHAVTSERPWVTLKLAVSIDGAVADHTRKTGWLTGLEARAEVHRWRAQHDAIGVGMGTVLADDPALTVRDAKAPRVAPMRVVFSRSGRLPVTSILARTARDVPVLVMADDPDPAYESTLNEMGVELIPAASLGEALRALRARGVQSILVEGGARLAGALMFDRLVDRLVVFTAPVVLGAGALNAFHLAPAQRAEQADRLRIVDRQPFGDDLMTVYALDHARDRETARERDSAGERP
ncbi:MAG: bifunctional diaminohydroxyphosphoribosylaminopyrimidine deaminase/5-amino-6-(5-phosphoribosylamino)uracil reductase RibD [Gemmatimonadetes bacterium]|nr:bifunctional diaminohydroxyphosphoribosylaminopyrimidine deaminase/5-amino-6-(5-phosphoribosylamino)uracil reductase RibD [Gemmatimonadota bacterium]